MSWFNTYNNIFEKIKVVLNGVSEVKSVNLSGAFKILSLPMAVVLPRETAVEQAVTGENLKCSLIFDVVLFVRETEPSDWFSEIVSPMSSILDAFLADRTLSGAVLNLTPIIFSPGEITALQRLYYGGLIRFQADYLFSY